MFSFVKWADYKSIKLILFSDSIHFDTKSGRKDAFGQMVHEF